MAIAKDIKMAGSWNERLGRLFREPGWRPQDGTPVSMAFLAEEPADETAPRLPVLTRRPPR
jgi:hypothetical protein